MQTAVVGTASTGMRVAVWPSGWGVNKQKLPMPLGGAVSSSHACITPCLQSQIHNNLQPRWRYMAPLHETHHLCHETRHRTHTGPPIQHTGPLTLVAPHPSTPPQPPAHPPLLMQLLMGTSTSRNRPANGMAGSARVSVRGRSSLPGPPPRIMTAGGGGGG